MSGNPMDQGYLLIADRLAAFVRDHPTGRIETELLYSQFDPAVSTGLVVVGAKVFKDGGSSVPDGMGMSGMQIPGTTNFTKGSEVENSETSAIGRALAAVGYLAKNPDGSARFASDDEIVMKRGYTTVQADAINTRPQPTDPKAKATRPQINRMFALAKASGIDTKTPDGKKLLQNIVLAATGKHSSTQLTMGDMDRVYERLSESIDQDKDDAQLQADKLAAVLEATGGEVIE